MSQNHLIKQLKQHMISDLEAAIEDREEEIIRAINKMTEERDPESEAPVKFTCSLSGALNLDKNTIETSFGFSVKTTLKERHQIEDPDQAELF